MRMILPIKYINLALLVFLLLIIYSCGLQPENQMDDINMEFGDLVPGVIGTGLELISDDNIIDFSGENWFGFFVVNTSNESIEFTNIHFSLLVFQYNEKNAKWEGITLKVIPKPRIITLPPGDQFSNLPNNIFSLNTDDFDIPANETALRFYIYGKGDDTGNIYGAYVDVPILLP